LAANSYKSPPWLPDTASPRDPSSVVSPHGRVRVWMNSVLVDSLRNGRDGVDSPPPDQWSMAVKEFYDDTDMLIGRAASIKSGAATSSSAWVYLCHGPEGRCFTSSPAFSESAALHGTGTNTMCGPCHGGLVFTAPPP
jgi:hypothetical protein